MATALSNTIEFPKRKHTNGYSKVPNAIVENQALFTHAEMAFLLLMFRRNNGDECKISDNHWVAWTGLKSRAKDYAVAGLASKCIEIEGRGDTAVFKFSRKQFGSFLTTAKPPELEKPRTKGRAVAAPAGAKMHEDCAQNGCFKLCEGCDVAQPVAQTGKGAAQPVAQVSTGTVVQINTALAQPVARRASKGSVVLAQPVAQTHPATCQIVASFFPTAGPDFVGLLIEKVKATVQVDPIDEELSQAVKAAHKRSQHSEGLFLSTVPNVMRRMVLSRDGAVTVEQLKPAIRSLSGLRGDKRFGTAAAAAIGQIKSLDLNQDQRKVFSELRRIQEPLLKLAVQYAKEAPDWASMLADITAECDRMNLQGSERSQHVNSLSWQMACIRFEIPIIISI